MAQRKPRRRRYEESEESDHGKISHDVRRRLLWTLYLILDQLLVAEATVTQITGMPAHRLHGIDDGARIRAAQFAIRGQLVEELFAIQASVECNRDIVLEFKQNRSEDFKLSGGCLCND
jgi:hypothetical protein